MKYQKTSVMLVLDDGHSLGQLVAISDVHLTTPMLSGDWACSCDHAPSVEMLQGNSADLCHRSVIVLLLT